MAKKKSKQARRAEKWIRQAKWGVAWDIVWKVLVSIFSFAGSMVAVYELVNYIRSDAKTFYSVIIPVLGITVWVVILYQFFRKKNAYAILFLMLTVIGGVAGGIGWQSYNQTQEDKVIVLIAEFDGPEETYGLRRQIMEDLREATRDYDDTIIIEGDELVTSGEYARKLGEQHKADLVIWAWYRPTENPNITIHIENLSPTEIEAIGESEVYQPQATLAQLESFEIQRQLGSETSTLVSFLNGVLRFQSGDYQTAIDRFEQVLNSSDISTHIDQHILLSAVGFSSFQIGNIESSIEYYSRAIEINPEFVEAYVNRGAIYAVFEEYDLAVQDFEKAISKNPNDALAYYNRGLIYLDILKQYNLAIQDFSKAIENNPQDSDSYTTRGIAYSELDQHERALQDWGQAIELNPKDLYAYYNRGLTYYDLMQYEQAVQDLSKYIEFDPQDPDGYYHRSLAYHDLGKITEAEADLKKYIELTGQKP